MENKLLEILKKAKEVDNRAKKYDSVDKTILESKINNMVGSESLVEKSRQITPNIVAGSDDYGKKVKESKLPKEIQKLMLENPIQQVDSLGTFSLSEDIIKEINPNYGKDKRVNRVVEEVEMVKGSAQQGFDAFVIKKMIAEEIAKALPSIVEKYFDKKMIQENIKALNSIKRVKKPNNNL